MARNIDCVSDDVWDQQKISKMMEIGMGNPNIDINSTFKRNSSYGRFQRKTYLRTRLFLCPFAQVFWNNWSQLVRPDLLMLKT